MFKDRYVLLVFPHLKTIFGPAEERKWRINKWRHWQHWNNCTSLYPIYINKLSLGEGEKERLWLWLKSFFRPWSTALWSLFMAASMFYNVDEIFGLVWLSYGQWLMMQSMYPNVTLTIHLWPTTWQHQELNKVSLKHYWMIYFYIPREAVDLPRDNCFKIYDWPWGFNASNADLALPRLEHLIKNCKTNKDNATSSFTVMKHD